MGILKGQTAARLIIQTNLDFNSITTNSVSIEYQKPSGKTGSWPAQILTSGKTAGDIYIDFTNNINFDEAGDWTLAAKVIFEDGRSAPGDDIIYTVNESV